MVGSKEHTRVSTNNIIKPTLEALSSDDQRFEDIMKKDKGGVLRELAERWIATKRSSIKGKLR